MRHHEENCFPTNPFGNSVVGQMHQDLVGCLQCPEEFAFAFLLGAVSAASGKGIEVESFDGRFSRPNLYFIISAESGFGKSEVGKVAFSPLYMGDKKLLSKFRTLVFPKASARLRLVERDLRRVENSAEADVGKIEKLLLEKAKIESDLTEPRLYVEDCTQEALEVQLCRQNGELAMISTDARAVLKNLLGKHRNGQTEEDVLIKAWSGDSFSTDRITRSSVRVEDPCLSVVIATQPDLFHKMVSQEHFLESGFFARILPIVVEAGSGTGGDFSARDKTLESQYDLWVGRIIEEYRGRKTAERVSLSVGARAVLEQFRSDTFREERENHQMGVCIRRWAEMATRVVLCLHLAEHGSESHRCSVSEEIAQMAVRLVQWFGHQQAELYNTVLIKKKNDLRLRLHELVLEREGECVSLRDAWKKLGSNSRSIQSLVDGDSRLEIRSGVTGGRPSQVIHLLPG